METNIEEKDFPESGYLKCKVDLMVEKYMILKSGKFYKFEKFGEKLVIEHLHFFWDNDRKSHDYYYTNFFEERVYEDKELRKIKLQILNQSA